MGLLAGLAWITRRVAPRRPAANGHEARRLRRIGQCEPLESRRLMAADPLPVHLGAVYFEDASGDDAVGDRIEVTFEGGAPGTQLTRLVITGDKDRDGQIDPAEVFFDTLAGGRGTFNPQPLEIVSHDGFEIVSMTVEDGSPQIVFELSGFEAGDKLVFTIDVDEQGSLSATAIAEGGEFEGSILTGTFRAPHYQDVTLEDLFLDVYTTHFADVAGAAGTTLDLPSDSYMPPATNNRSDMTAGAAAQRVQPPLPITISGRVYEDRDLDNQQDASDSGLTGVSLALWTWDGAQYVDTGKTAATNGAGDYAFTGVLPGKYQVRETQPSGFISVGATAGTVDGSTRGQVLSADVIGEIDLLGGEDSVRNDFAEARPATLSGHVYHDRDNDGLLDPGEEGIAGVSLQVIGVQTIGGPPATVTVVTNAFGYWEAAGLNPGTYRVVELQPAGYLDGLDRAGSAGGAALNPGDEISGITLASGTVGTHYDFGELVPSSISGLVHGDLDGDCLYDPGEPLLAGVTIELDAAGGTTPVATTTTDSQGRYKFEGLRPGTYEVREIQPAGYFDGAESVGTAGGVVKADDWLGSIVLVSGTTAEHYDFCEILPSSIRGMVHADTDGDCLFDEGEAPLVGVTIELLDQTGTVIATTKTDAHGQYAFENLRPGTYSVRETQPPGYLDGAERVGTAGGVLAANDLIGQIVLVSGTHGENYDFCEIPPASISGMVHADLDGDCLYDPGEPLLAGAQIDLLDAGGHVIRSTTTDAQGAYRFDNLAPGTYGIREHQPPGYYDSAERVGSAGGVISADDTITQIVLGAGVQAVDYDFCEALPSRIEGMVHADSDGDCLFDPGEQPLAGVTIQLLDATGAVIATTTTDEQGRYAFADLAPGTYGVRELQPAGYFDGGESVGTAGGQIASDDTITGIVLISATEALHYDFCELLPNSLRGMVHADLDGDCLLDEGELPLAGVRIDLLDSAGNVVRTTFTDEHGEYVFDNLPSGTYSIREHQPAGYLDGGDRVGTLGGQLGGNDLITGIVLISGNHGQHYDFCEIPPASLSGMVHVDTDGDCVFDPGEPPLAGVTIELLDAAGRVVRTTVTNAQGEYRFDNLAPGNYGVREIQPAGYLDSGESIGTAGGLVAANDLITNIVLPAGFDAEGYDFCEQFAGKISGYVFQDGPAVLQVPGQETDLLAGKDGLRTPDDTPIAGVRLRLADAQGNPILDESGQPRVAVSDAAGYYEFADLPPGQYTVYEEQPAGYIDAIDTPGSTGGQAVNPGGPALMVVLAQPHNNDVLVGIPLPGGGDSIENNFSEVRVVAPVIFPALVAGPAPEVVAAPLFPAAPAFILRPPVLFVPDQPPLYGGSSAVLGYTWHLSIVDAGRPRGADAGPSTAARARAAVRAASATGWADANLEQSQWQRNAAQARTRQMFGMRGATPIVGDFNGDGHSEMGVFHKGEWYIDLNGNGVWDEDDLWAKLGHQDDKPVVGDWNGDGKTDIGIFGPAWPRDPSVVAKEPGLPDPLNPEKPEAKNLPPRPERAAAGVRELRRTARGARREDLIDHVFFYGTPLDIPLVGDWNGDGIDTVAVFYGGQWYLDVDGDGKWSPGDLAANFGAKGDVPVVGDWDGNGIDDLGLYRDGTWYLDTNRNRRLDPEDRVAQLGGPGDVPVVGDWDGDGVDEPGVYIDGERMAAEPADAKGPVR